MIQSLSSVIFEFLWWFVQDSFSLIIILIHSFFRILPVVHEDFLKFCAIFPLILFKKNKLHAKSVVCHQFNLMKDKQTINLILTSSKWVIPSFGVCSWWINSSFKCLHLFFSGSSISSAISSEPPSKSSQGSSYSFILHLYLIILLSPEFFMVDRHDLIHSSKSSSRF